MNDTPLSSSARIMFNSFMNSDEPRMTVSLSELEVALEKVQMELKSCKETLRELVEGNRPSFLAHLQRVENLERLWRPLEFESVARKVYGDNLAISIAQLCETQMHTNNFLEPPKDSDEMALYIKYVKEYLSQRAYELGRLPDYEKCTVSFPTTMCKATTFITIKTVVSQKSKMFSEELLLQSTNLEMLPAPNSKEIIRNAVLIYLDTFERNFSSQLCQLPHLATLFYADSRFLSAIMYLKAGGGGGVTVEECQQVELIGMGVMQKMLNRQKDELAELCPIKMWQLRYGNFDHQFLMLLKKSLNQALLKIGQVSKVLLPILDSCIYVECISEMLQALLNWVWNGFMKVKCIERDALQLLPELVLMIVKAPIEILGKEKYVREEGTFKVCRKLELLTRIAQQNLIQVSNSFRRGEYSEALTLGEFRSLVQSLFPETAMRSAFIAEIDAEIN